MNKDKDINPFPLGSRSAFAFYLAENIPKVKIIKPLQNCHERISVSIYDLNLIRFLLIIIFNNHINYN